MKTIATLATAAILGLGLVGTAEAMPVAPTATVQSPVIDVAVVVTKTVRRGPFGGRRVVTRVVRRPMSRTVTTTRVVR